ncbi:hypothetical protein H2200_012155 [Cladophialophora chaetospira]|uniref:DNA (cytosine-5-)-methyltransferase n=1 Tax=Cladophialophora chaetospira TaxID=386627 RepID=A0AA38WYC7_9EURO|nr:hypothetical protein H2200_012155 [Cladophialophora chaetospira]
MSRLLPQNVEEDNDVQMTDSPIPEGRQTRQARAPTRKNTIIVSKPVPTHLEAIQMLALGYDVKLRDGRFMRVEHIHEQDRKIEGRILILQDHRRLFVPYAKHELVRLGDVDGSGAMQAVEAVVAVEDIVRYCTIIFTNQPYQYMHARVRTSEKWTTIKTLHLRGLAGLNDSDPTWVDDVIVQGIQRIPSKTHDTELRLRWRGEGHTQLGGNHTAVRGKQVRREYTFAEPFCGAGGPSLGAAEAGLRLMHAFDCDEEAMNTYRHEFQVGRPFLKAVTMDVADYIHMARNSPDYIVDVVHMSPPCQPFSGANANLNPEEDERNVETFRTVGILLKVHKPRFATLEESFGLGSRNNLLHFRELVGFFTNHGFSVQWNMFNLARFGVPQNRKRLIFVAAAPGERLPNLPTVTHGDEPGLRPWVNIGDAINNIPTSATDHDIHHIHLRRPRRNPAGRITPVSMTDRSNTVMTDGNSDRVHHPDNRIYTIRELAALQTYPHDFEFFGTWGQKCTQIGNDVPPRFAEILYRDLITQIKAFDQEEMNGMNTTNQ